MHDDSNIRTLRGKDNLHLVKSDEQTGKGDSDKDIERRIAQRLEGEHSYIGLVPEEARAQADDLEPRVRELPIDGEVVALRNECALLKQEHKDLDDSISALEIVPLPDQILIARLKRKKLALRDQIAKIEDKIRPDIIA
ncbi:YdcH family protein [Asticcacaulis taihuensis]|jgi:hypothetical protein|uniref:DUF465 domain-containing protein n=1 Tax=Asticcacaulis taihuensis TaxID=260084 RepID=A0A1G4QDL6_9CAUL|nr:DUF465 domain-containing protein [Asticcacaulis taihuensis]SCW42670.1 hypothetical protein SAMN02927928_1144 [Asticcacaulis taihuensis]